MKKHYATLCLVALAWSAQAQRSSGEVLLQNDQRVALVVAADSVTVTLIGPADRWYAVGFDAQAMQAGTDVVYYGSGPQGVRFYDAYLVGNAAPVADPQQDWVVASETVTAGIRTLVARRARATNDNNDYNFAEDIQVLPVIYAHGNGASTSLAFHGGNRGATALNFTVTSASAPLLAQSVRVYPNPAQGLVSIDPGTALALERVRLFDATARCLREVTPTVRVGEAYPLSLGGLKGGIYFLEITAGSQRTVQRLRVE